MNNMSIKPDYKRTEVGVIPEDWEVGELGDLEPFVTSGSRGWATYYSDQGDAFLRITNLTRESIYPELSDLRLVKLPPDDKEGTRTSLQNGDLLISITADIGIIGYIDSSVPKPAYINQHIALVRFDKTKIDSKFLGYYLAGESSQRLFRAMVDQGAKAGMSLIGVRKIRAAFPPPSEQRAIAEVLTDVDALLIALERLIAKKRAVRQGTMQVLLTGRVRLPGFNCISGYKHTEAGTIPEDWKVQLIGDCFSIHTGTSKSQYIQADGSYFIVDMGSVSRTGALLTEKTTNFKGDFLESGDLVMPKDDIGGGNIIGKVAYIGNSNQYVLGDHIYVLRIKHGESRFFAYMINSDEINRALKKKVSGSAQLGLAKKSVEDQGIPVPAVPEQTAIAEVLSDMDAEIEALEKRRSKLRAIKQGMMQELLTGRVRLVQPQKHTQEVNA